MARCKRCGATFDYDKKDGVCPKCCFYNRPPGMASHDEEWISTYNVEENTYELPKSIVETMEDEPHRIFGRRHSEDRRKVVSSKDCHTEGSHVHTERAARKKAERTRELKQEKSGKPRAFFIFLVLIIIISGCGPWIKEAIKKISSGSGQPKPSEVTAPDFAEDTATQAVLQEGLAIGDLTFSTDDKGAFVLFQEGEIPELPPGEKCVAIHLTANESELDYDGIHWERPYVYDGKHYRKLVGGLLFGGMGLPWKMNTKFMYEYLSGDGDFDGLACFFVDKDAETVTLCIPKQTIVNDEVVCTGVVDIELPVTENPAAASAQ